MNRDEILIAPQRNEARLFSDHRMTGDDVTKGEVMNNMQSRGEWQLRVGCQNVEDTVHNTDNSDYVPNPYSLGLTEMRIAEHRAETPAEQFERQYQLSLVRGQEQSMLDKDADEGIRDLAVFRLTVEDDLQDYDAPNAYAAGLKALHSK